MSNNFYSKCPGCNPYLLGKKRPRKGRRAAVEEAIRKAKNKRGKWLLTPQGEEQ